MIALATLVSEDLTCIATGVLIAQHKLGVLEGIGACLAGIFFGDLLLFLLGRLVGDPRVLGRWIPEERIATATEWIQERGLRVVMVSRFTPGLRLPTYVAAGLLRSRFWAFTGYFFVASALWTPLLVGGTAAFGEQALRSTVARESPLFAVALAVAIFALSRLRTFENRRRVVGFIHRKLRWEFWPAWAAYMPLIPYLLYLAVKHCSVTLFTAANPGMFSGGLMGESKAQILSHLSRVPDSVAAFTVIPAGEHVRVDEFPSVLKPDVGERGNGVAIVRNQSEVDAYLRAAKVDTILQRYVAGVEFGIYYVRFPEQRQGRVLYVTEKRFPFVMGDGRSSFKELILRDPRAVCMASTYLRSAKRRVDGVPAAGEKVPLVEIGSHCRGTIFLDGTHLITPELTASIDRLSQAHPEFYLGRYDVRTDCVASLQRGHFQVIELNGVSAEATHVYDPSISIWRTYHVMAQHWRTAFEIGAINQARGFQPMTMHELRQLLFPARPARQCPVNAGC